MGSSRAGRAAEAPADRLDATTVYSIARSGKRSVLRRRRAYPHSGARPPIPFTPELRNRRTTSDHIADALRAAINSGQLADGAELNQVEIAGHFGVSRVPVREAMRQLQAEGLIDASAHRRAVVRGIEIDTLREAYELRALLEGRLAAGRRAEPRQSPARPPRRAQQRAERGERPHALPGAEQPVPHDELYEVSDRPLAQEFVESLRQRSERYVQMWSRGRGLNRGRQVAREHAAIVRLARQGDAAGVQRAVEEHIQHTLDAVLALHEQQPVNRRRRRRRVAAARRRAPSPTGLSDRGRTPRV